MANRTEGVRCFFAWPLLSAGLAACLAGIPAPAAEPPATGNALQAYVRAPDATFGWTEIKRWTDRDLTLTQVEVTSQTWREHRWRHQILIVRPATVRNPDVAFLHVCGDDEVGSRAALLGLLARRAGSVAAAINRVPNQPLYGGRSEDALIAYTFEQYLRTGDRSWPLLFPMVKSAVRGMDTVVEWAHREHGQEVRRFVVSGASKRGWTTWLSAAADNRVKAIAPMVIDVLNMKAQTEWAERMYGRQSEQIGDYTEYDFTKRMDEPRMVELRNWVDPYSYRTRYRLPKLLLLGTNDPYWVVDSLRHYWSELPKPKLLFQTPNGGHDLAGGGEANQTLAAFFQMVADRQKLPIMNWRLAGGATTAELTATVAPGAKAFRLWTALSSDRDFRNDRWSAVALEAATDKKVRQRIEAPVAGYRAYMIEADLVSPTGDAYKLSTEARVIPDGPPKKQGGKRPQPSAVGTSSD